MVDNAYNAHAEPGHGYVEGVESHNVGPVHGTVAAKAAHKVGGLDSEMKRLVELVYMPVMYKELFNKIDLERAHGVLIHGPSGTGKTLLVKALFDNVELNHFFIDATILRDNIQIANQMLQREFEIAAEKPNSVIVIDNLDQIANKDIPACRAIGDAIGRLMDASSEKYNGTMLIGIVSDANRISNDLRRGNRFESEIEIGVPNRKARNEILRILIENKHTERGFSIDKIAEITNGYTGADLVALVKEASFMAVKEVIENKKLVRGGVAPAGKHVAGLRIEDVDVQLKNNHVVMALEKVKPSTIKDTIVDVPMVRWDDVGGLEKVKGEIREAVELPLTNPSVFDRMGVRPIKGILLYGPPGTGKTLLVKAAANESNANFISVKASELLKKYVGESEAAVRSIFKKAQLSAPSIIFIDEIDSIAGGRNGNRLDSGVRESILNTLLTELDGVRELKNVVVIGATNRPDLIDTALLRPGRFDRVIEIPVPDKAARIEILRIHTAKMPLSAEVDLARLAEATDKYSGAELENLCREAGMIAIRNGKKEIAMADFSEALKDIFPALTGSTLELYRSIRSSQRKEEIGFRPRQKQA